MTYRCGYYGHAAATRTDRLNAEPSIVWTQADEKTHISKELTDNPTAMYEIARKYVVGSWCDEAQAYHAQLIKAGQ